MLTKIAPKNIFDKVLSFVKGNRGSGQQQFWPTG